MTITKKKGGAASRIQQDFRILITIVSMKQYVLMLMLITF